MTVILVRHGRSTANTAGVLAGRTPGVSLDDTGRGQAAELAERLGDAVGHIRTVARSPLQRCAETVAPLIAEMARTRGTAISEIVADDLVEVDYGSWTNRPIGELLKEPLWRTVQQQPSAAVFPDGEGLAAVQARAVRAVRDLDRIYGGEDGTGLWVACSHGDVIKAILADAMGTHLDAFQRIVVEPASISVVRYSSARPYVHTVNSTSRVAIPLPRPADENQPAEHRDDAIVGGDTGTPSDGPASQGDDIGAGTPTGILDRATEPTHATLSAGATRKEV